ncbi:MAG TPA: hypothetical protein VK186_03885 [Candidatus Deferrimicrobium sp.]|nr:hypothetical protein [Candidatus Deferrimicrobium sp.]
MNNKNYLTKCLTQLNATGPQGFEGLIANLLEKLTGERFYLAKAGYQAGKDFSNGNWIAVECKRYSEKSHLDEREILGEFLQAQLENPGLELWVLVTSIDPDNQLVERLIKAGQERGIEIRFIESKKEGIGNLEILCANGDDIVLDFLTKNVKIFYEEERIRNILNSIKNEQYYQDKVKSLQNYFLKCNLGYEHWRIMQNKWLLEQFASAQNSRCSFHQAINVTGLENTYIKRKIASEKLDSWLEKWRSGNKQLFILSGEQGDGKTWTVSAWIAENIRNNTTIPFLFLPARKVSSTEIIKLLSKAIYRSSNFEEHNFWAKRISNWMERASSGYDPILVLVIDGLDEYYDFDWASILNTLSNENERFYERIAVVLTVRAVYWKERMSKLEHTRRFEWLLPPFNDEELSEALKKYNLTIYDFPSDIQPLIRKPRHFDLVIKYRKEMAESGDITVYRLVYEDLKDRFKNNQNFTFTDSDFEALIIESAEKALNGNNSLNLQDLSNLLPLVKNANDILGQLITGGIFIRDEKLKNKFKLEPIRLAYGLGILLVNKLNDIPTLNPKVIEDEIKKFFEPQPEIDFKTEIAGAAVFQVMKDLSYPEEIRYELLKYWSYSLNRKWNYVEPFSAYFSVSPDTYFKLAENTLKANSLDYEIQRALEYTFYLNKDEVKILKLFKIKFEEWMGYINIYGSYRHSSDDDEKLHKKMVTVANRLGMSSITAGKIDFLGYSFILTKEDETQMLSELALRVISNLDRSQFLNCLIKGVIAECIMGSSMNSEKFRWLFRMNNNPLWSQLEKDIQRLINTGNSLAQEAAYYILGYEGSPEATEKRNSLPPEFSGSYTNREEYEKDLCNSYIWALKKKDYFECMKRSDVTLYKLNWKTKDYALEPGLPVPDCYIERLINFGKGINPAILWRSDWDTNEDHQLEQYKISFYAFCPEIIAGIIRAIIRDFKNRNLDAIRNISEISENYLIFGNSEIEAIKQTWTKISICKSGAYHDWVEKEFSRIIVNELTVIEQLQLMINREINVLKPNTFLKRISGQDWEEVSDLMTHSDDDKLWKLLYLISKFSLDIPKSLLKEISKFFTHQNSAVRAYALKIAYDSKDPELIETFLQSNWQYTHHHDDYFIPTENYYGSLLTTEYAATLSYEEIKKRISPYMVSDAIFSRGMKRDEIEKFITDFIFEGQEANKSPSTSTNFCGPHCGNRLLIEIIKTNPLLIQQWLDPISANSPETDKRIHNNHAFYTYLCGIFFQLNPAAGVQLFKRLKKVRGLPHHTYENTKIEAILYNVFNPSIGREEKKELWDEIIHDCVTDKVVLEISVVCHRMGNTEWYNTKAANYLSSVGLIEKARGVNMLGFSCDQTVINRLDTFQNEIPECWLKPVIDAAIKRWNLNQWAMTWYQRFMENQDEIIAWAGFHLFLRCVDRRYWTWKKDMEEKFTEKNFFEKRKLFLELNEALIKKSIEKNEEGLQKKFLGLKIEESIHPCF